MGLEEFDSWARVGGEGWQKTRGSAPKTPQDQRAAEALPCVLSTCKIRLVILVVKDTRQITKVKAC